MNNFNPYTLDDEYSYKITSNQFFQKQEFQECYEYVENKCISQGTSIWLPAWPFIMSFTNVLGDNYKLSFGLNILLSLISIILVFILAYQITNNEKLSLISSLLIANLPVHIRISSSMGAEISSFLFLITSLILFFLFKSRKKPETLFLLIITVIITIQVKMENIAIIILFLIIFLVYKDEIRKQILNKKFKNQLLKRKMFLVVLILIIVGTFFYSSQIVYIINQDISGLDWMSSQTSFYNNLSANIPRNIMFWLSNDIHPFIITILSIIGIPIFLRKESEKSIIFIALFIIYFAIYSFHNHGDFNIGSASRYTIHLYISIIIISLYGIKKIIDMSKKSKTRKITIMLISFILIAMPLGQLDYLISDSMEQKELFKFVESNIPKGCLILTDKTAIPIIAGYQSIHSDNLFKYGRIYEIECSFLYERKILSNSDLNVSQIYFLLDLEKYKPANNIYGERKNPFYKII